MDHDPSQNGLPDFSHVKASRVEPGDTAWFEMGIDSMPGARVRGVCGHPSINLEMTAAMMETAALAYPKEGESKAKSIGRQRDESVDAFAEHVLVGWERVFNSAGSEVPFSPGACGALLRALPLEKFDELRAFFITPKNFRKAIPTAAIVGNSPAGSPGN